MIIIFIQKEVITTTSGGCLFIALSPKTLKKDMNIISKQTDRYDQVMDGKLINVSFSQDDHTCI